LSTLFVDISHFVDDNFSNVNLFSDIYACEAISNFFDLERDTCSRSKRGRGREGTRGSIEK
jgi:hypothetical protein